MPVQFSPIKTCLILSRKIHNPLSFGGAGQRQAFPKHNWGRNWKVQLFLEQDFLKILLFQLCFDLTTSGFKCYKYLSLKKEVVSAGLIQCLRFMFLQFELGFLSSVYVNYHQLIRFSIFKVLLNSLPFIFLLSLKYVCFLLSVNNVL